MGAAIPVLELLGGFRLIAGLFNRFVGLLFAGISIVPAVAVRWDNGLYRQSGGIEYDLVLAVASLVLVATGPGLFAPDRWPPANTPSDGAGPTRFPPAAQQATSRPVTVRH